MRSFNRSRLVWEYGDPFVSPLPSLLLLLRVVVGDSVERDDGTAPNDDNDGDNGREDDANEREKLAIRGEEYGLEREDETKGRW